MKTKSELLSVLKMTEAEQASWLYHYGILPNKEYGYQCTFEGKHCYRFLQYFVACVNFELRDMAVEKDENKYFCALNEILCILFNVRKKKPYIEDMGYFLFRSKPIEFIIAALLVLDCSDF